MDYRKTLAINAAIVVALLLGLIVILKTISKRLERKEAEKEQVILIPTPTKPKESKGVSDYWESIHASPSELSDEEPVKDILRRRNRNMKSENFWNGEREMVDYLCDEDLVHVSDELYSLLIFPNKVDVINVSGDELIDVDVYQQDRSLIAVRAVEPFSKTTSFSAKTSDGVVYTYTLDYVKAPSKTILCAEKNDLKRIAKVDTVEVSDFFITHLNFDNSLRCFVYEHSAFLIGKGTRGGEYLDIAEKNNSILRISSDEPFQKTKPLIVMDNKGAVYPFIVKYNNNPRQLTIRVHEPKLNSTRYSGFGHLLSEISQNKNIILFGFCGLAALVLILFVIVITQRVRIKNCRKGINHINWQIELLERYRKDLQQKLNGSPADEWNQENSKNGYEKKYINKSYLWNECVSVSFRLNNDEALYRMAFESTSGHLGIYSDVPVPRRVVEVVERALNDELDREELWSELSLALSLPVDFLKDTIIVSVFGWVHLKESDATFLGIWPNSVFADDVIKSEQNRLWYLFYQDEKSHKQEIFDPDLFHPESDGVAFRSGEPFDESDALVPTDMDGPSAVDFDSEENTDV